MKKSKGVARKRILEVATDLFYHSGIRAVGVDTIVAQSGVAKTTLYDHFASKDDLIDAYLTEQDHLYWIAVDEALSKHPDSPRQQLIDLFEGFEVLITRSDFFGCPFLSATAEFPELEQPGHRIAIIHKQKLRAQFKDLAEAAGAKDAMQLADQLLLLLDGAFASKRVFRTNDSPVAQLRTAANILVTAHLAGGD